MSKPRLVYTPTQRVGARHKYYPKGYKPQLLEEWPVDSDLVVPMEALPENLKDSMGGHWRMKQENQKVLIEQAKGAKKK